jgi:hypothetical protein
MSLEDAISALAAMDPKLELTKYHAEDGDSWIPVNVSRTVTELPTL